MTVAHFFRPLTLWLFLAGKTSVELLLHFIVMFTSGGISGIFERLERSQYIH